MKFFKLNKTFVEDESGAVTVDWVVLTAAIVGIAIAVLAVIRTGINSTATKINNVLTSQLTNY
ncbi:MAG: hypothetical protein ACE5FS_00250 [Paracoccaceae bacterium]